MIWLTWLVLGSTASAAMNAAVMRGDLDEAARQAVLAGPAVVERALAAADRPRVLAAIAAAPIVEDGAELLPALARIAGAPDRRTAIPAAAAARAIARALARRDRPDDLADDDLATWRSAWAELAMRGDRWIELRVLALDAAAALDRAGVGVDLATALRDPDPAFRRAAAELVPWPALATTFAPLGAAVARDGDREVALAAARALCGGLQDPAPALDALGAAGLARIRDLVTAPRAPSKAALRDLGRCLVADPSGNSAAGLRVVRAAGGLRP
jgi:hypothetical protein